MKAKGIAKDIFGSYENYVLPVQSLSKENDLVDAFKWMQNREEKIKMHLCEFMPNYKAKSLRAVDEVAKLI